MGAGGRYGSSLFPGFASTPPSPTLASPSIGEIGRESDENVDTAHHDVPGRGRHGGGHGAEERRGVVGATGRADPSRAGGAGTNVPVGADGTVRRETCSYTRPSKKVPRHPQQGGYADGRLRW